MFSRIGKGLLAVALAGSMMPSVAYAGQADGTHAGQSEATFEGQPSLLADDASGSTDPDSPEWQAEQEKLDAAVVEAKAAQETAQAEYDAAKLAADEAQAAVDAKQLEVDTLQKQVDESAGKVKSVVDVFTYLSTQLGSADAASANALLQSKTVANGGYNDLSGDDTRDSSYLPNVENALDDLDQINAIRAKAGLSEYKLSLVIMAAAINNNNQSDYVYESSGASRTLEHSRLYNLGEILSSTSNNTVSISMWYTAEKALVQRVYTENGLGTVDDATVVRVIEANPSIDFTKYGTIGHYTAIVDPDYVYAGPANCGSSETNYRGTSVVDFYTRNRVSNRGSVSDGLVTGTEDYTTDQMREAISGARSYYGAGDAELEAQLATAKSDLAKLTATAATAKATAEAKQVALTAANEKLASAEAAAEEHRNPVRDLTQAEVTLSETSVVFTGTAVEPQVTVTLGGATLIEGKQYTVSYSGNVDLGDGPTTAKATVTGISPYTGTVERTFTMYSKAAEVFPDVNYTDWFVTTGVVDYAYAKGLLSGYTSGENAGLFGSHDTITRAQVATILWRIAGTPTAASQPFEDVDYSAWYGDAISWARATGVVGGYTDADGVQRRFGPNDKVTREQLATMVANYAAKVAGKDTSTTYARLLGISDRNDISDWARASVSWCMDEGIISGYDSNGVTVFAPADNAERCQAAKIFTIFHRDVLGVN